MPSSFSDGDLNGLVDGHLEPGRQADVLQRLKSHPADRARVETWREHNDLIRATFSEVTNEPLPVSLSLAPPPHLRCVSSDGRPSPQRAGLVPPPKPGQRSEGLRPGFALAAPVPESRSRRRPLAAMGATGLVGLLGAWMILTHPAATDPQTTSVATSSLAGPPIGSLDNKRLDDKRPDDKGLGIQGREAKPFETIPVEALFTDADLRDLKANARKGDDILAARTRDSLTRLPHASDVDLATRESLDLPIAAIPDLGTAGFWFTGAIRAPGDPAALVFLYENAHAERLALGVTATASAKAAEVRPTEPALTWHRHGKAFALAGTIDRPHLATIAGQLQAMTAGND